MFDFNEWKLKNKYILIYLYNNLYEMAKQYDIKIINNDVTYNNFLKMMYNESSKEVISRELFPEYYDISYHSKGYDSYNIFDI
jgi:hypothetical protein